MGLLAFTGDLFFYNNLPLLDLLFRSMTVAVRCHIAAGIVFVLCSLPEVVGMFNKHPKKGHLEAALILVLMLSGAMICCRDRFGFEMKYGLAVVHASSALFFLSLRVARWYGAAMRRKPQQEKKWRANVTFEPIDR